MITIGSLHRAPDPPVESGPAPAATGEPLPISEPEISGRAAPEEATQPKKSFPLMVIPITLSVGLLVASGYVGHRIVTAKSQAPGRDVAVATSGPVRYAPVKPAPLKPAAVEPAVSKPLAIATATPPEKIQATASIVKEAVALPEIDSVISTGDSTDLIDPQPGQRYLQIAAISSRAADWFMADLRRDHMQVRLAPGPHEGLVRVLIGPFPDWDSLNTVKAQIQHLWPDTFVRAY